MGIESNVHYYWINQAFSKEHWSSPYKSKDYLQSLKSAQIIASIALSLFIGGGVAAIGVTFLGTGALGFGVAFGGGVLGVGVHQVATAVFKQNNLFSRYKGADVPPDEMHRSLRELEDAGCLKNECPHFNDWGCHCDSLYYLKQIWPLPTVSFADQKKIIRKMHENNLLQYRWMRGFYDFGLNREGIVDSLAEMIPVLDRQDSPLSRALSRHNSITHCYFYAALLKNSGISSEAVCKYLNSLYKNNPQGGIADGHSFFGWSEEFWMVQGLASLGLITESSLLFLEGLSRPFWSDIFLFIKDLHGKGLATGDTFVLLSSKFKKFELALFSDHYFFINEFRKSILSAINSLEDLRFILDVFDRFKFEHIQKIFEDKEAWKNLKNLFEQSSQNNDRFVNITYVLGFLDNDQVVNRLNKLFEHKNLAALFVRLSQRGPQSFEELYNETNKAPDEKRADAEEKSEHRVSRWSKLFECVNELNADSLSNAQPAFRCFVEVLKDGTIPEDRRLGAAVCKAFQVGNKESPFGDKNSCKWEDIRKPLFVFLHPDKNAEAAREAADSITKILNGFSLDLDVYRPS